MTWTYAEGMATTKDVVREAIGDTNAAAPLRSDERISATIVRFASASRPIDSTVAFLVSGLANEYRTRPSSFSESGGVSVSWADRVRGWDALVRSLAKGEITFEAGDAPIAGGFAAPFDLTFDIYTPTLAMIEEG